MTMLKGTKLEGITNQNVFLRITTSSAMEKNFNSQLIDFDIKQQEEIRQLATGLGKD